MRLDPRMLRQFLAVCREGSISRAAKSEHVSQPSVSMAIGQLERVLGVKLFHRTHKGVLLTSAGEALKLKALAIENLLVTAQEEIKSLADEVSGPLHIGGTPGAMSSVMGEVIREFCGKYPSFKIKLTECHEATAHRLLKTYDLDIAILTAGPYSLSDDFTELPLFSDSLLLVTGKANSHLPDHVNIAELARHRWLLPDKVSGFKHQINTLFLDNDIPLPSNVIYTDSLLTLKRILINSDYLAILPRDVVKSELESRQLRSIEINNFDSRRRVGLIWLAERDLSPFAKAFVGHASECIYS
ncbi:LysR family transcriptional regulator [Alteromonas sp. 1_MG-2023]|uniref:LysR family transcriptional regulator n=1 Tax=Alteromonas sp. 1_MG-2023 TaxID=3062669 RepID=UPI0026E42D66|nr:LysR family transcriptional regulator [Alteromonas sp. 1_MG-2023]MDO6477306.1 LysR family transcriptional regulator [Alteromonas sp. 1_MG-2023]